MKAFLYIVVSIVLQSIVFESEAQGVDGTALFNTNCAACHSIGGGKLVGPDLSGVRDRYDIAWINRFIRESQVMIEEGDEQAVAVFNANSMIPMPSMPLSDEQIDAILDHITTLSNSKPDPVVIIKEEVANTTLPDRVSIKVPNIQNETVKEGMITGLWIVLAASAVMIVGIWYALKSHRPYQ
ncbi:MAG: cytochrome c [Cyclobacteriaceae bacterium]